MNRFEFVNKLNGRLYLLSEAERRDIIDEYIGHIDLKMQSGKTESEAIKDFGDIDELAQEILEAYHIDSSKVAGKTIDIYIKQIFDYFSRVAEKILGFSAAQLAQFFVEFVVLLLLLNVLRFPIGFCADIFSRLFSWMPASIYHFIDRLTELVANILCVLMGFVFIYQFINKKVINSNIVPKQTEIKREAETAPSGEKMRSAAAQKVSDTAEKIRQTGTAASRTVADAADKTGRKVADINRKTGQVITGLAGKTGNLMKKLAGSTGDFVINLSILIVKITLFLFLWAPSAILTIAGIVCTIVAAIIYFTTGIGFIGVCIAGVGCCIIGGAFTLWLTALLTGGKTENA